MAAVFSGTELAPCPRCIRLTDRKGGTMSSRLRSTVVGTLVGMAIATAAATLVPAKAEIDFDVRGGVNADAEGPFVGAGILTEIGQSRSWYFNPNAEYTAGDTVDVLSV